MQVRCKICCSDFEYAQDKCPNCGAWDSMRYINDSKREFEVLKTKKLLVKSKEYKHHLEYPISGLWNHFSEEIVELCDAFKEGNTEKMKEELIDVSNIIDMLYDSIG